MGVVEGDQSAGMLSGSVVALQSLVDGDVLEFPAFVVPDPPGRGAEGSICQ